MQKCFPTLSSSKTNTMVRAAFRAEPTVERKDEFGHPLMPLSPQLMERARLVMRIHNRLHHPSMDV